MFFLAVISIVEKMPEIDATRQAHIDLRQAMYQVDMIQMKQLAAGTYEMTTENSPVEKPRTLDDEDTDRVYTLQDMLKMCQNMGKAKSTSRPSSTAD